MKTINDNDTVILSGRRSAIGKYGGALRDYPLHDWAPKILRSALDHANVKPEAVQQLITGRCFGLDNRRITLAAGISVDAVSSAVYMACGSGLMAVQQAHRLIRLEEAEVAAAGGMEHLSAVPYYSHHTRWGARYGNVELEDALKTGFSCPTTGLEMGQTAENIRRKHNISRQEQDEFAYWSQEKADAATRSGRFKEEIEPIEIPQPRGKTLLFDADEHPRLSSMEKLAALKPVFEKDGTVTAGNASGINDGAAFLVLTSGAYAKKENLKPLARIVSIATSGIDPTIMGLGPVLAMQRALQKAALKPEDIDLYEINEAFAAQVLGVVREFPIPKEKLNVNGGAVALGHPIGCSGARITVTLLHELRRRGLRRGMASLCVGGGMGIATIVEML